MTDVETRGVAASTGQRWDAAVPWLLLFGGVVVVGWFIGLWLLWRSATWSLHQKVLGTLVIPGGLVPFWTLLARRATSGGCRYSGGVGLPTVRHCVTNTSTHIGLLVVVILVLAVAPIAVVLYLDRVRRHSNSGYG